MCTPQYASVFAENKVWGGPLSVLCFSASGLVYPIPRIKYGSDIVTSSVLSFHNLVIPLDPMLRCAFIHGTWCDQPPPPSSDRPLLGVRVGSFYSKYGLILCSRRKIFQKKHDSVNQSQPDGTTREVPKNHFFNNQYETLASGVQRREPCGRITKIFVDEKRSRARPSPPLPSTTTFYGYTSTPTNMQKGIFFMKKLKNVSCEHDRSDGWNSTFKLRGTSNTFV